MPVIFSHGRRVQPLVQVEIVREFRYRAELEVEIEQLEHEIEIEQLEHEIEIEQVPELEVQAP